MEELEALFEQASKEEQKVILALDNDKAGQEMSRRLQEELAAKGCEYEEEFVLGGKDWNEALVQIKQEAREQREGLKVEQKQEEAEEERGEEALKASQHEEVLGTGEEVDVGLGQEEGLKENWEQVVGLLEKEFTYEHSVLDQAQISEEVYKGCVDHMYADEEQVVIGLYQNVGQDKELCSAVHYHWDEQGELHEQVQEARGQGLAVIESEEQAESIVITQSPLEALLLKQQGLEEVQRLEEEIKKEQGKGKEELREELESKKEELARTKYVSYCGVLSEEVQKELKGVLEEAKSEGQKVSFVLEKESMKEVKGLLAEVGYEQQAKEGPRERVGRGLGVGSEVLAGLSALSRIDGGGDEVEEEEEGTKKKRGKGMRI
jgi:5S rRNA maturation endonuclease (ribonuclease M5)